MSAEHGGCIYRNMAIANFMDSVAQEGGLIEVTTSEGGKVVSRYRPIVFHDAAGRRYYWLMLHLQTVSPETIITDWRLHN